MRNIARIIGLFSIAALAGCGESDTIQLKPGQAPPELTEPEKAQIKSADERVDAEERANTPRSSSTGRR